MIRHQERRSVWPDDRHLVALGKIAKIIRGYATHRRAVMILGDALHGERQVVVARPLAIARARDRIETHVMRPAVGIGSRRNDADGLAFEHRKCRAAEIEHEVADVARSIVGRQSKVASDGADRRLGQRIEIDVGMRGRPRWRHVAALARGGDRPDARDVVRRFRAGVGRNFRLRRQAVPRELLGDRIWIRAIDLAPVVDGAGRAGRDAFVAEIALRCVDDVVAGVVRNGIDRTGLFACVAANADLRVDEVLAQHLDDLHICFHAISAADSVS